MPNNNYPVKNGVAYGSFLNSQHPQGFINRSDAYLDKNADLVSALLADLAVGTNAGFNLGLGGSVGTMLQQRIGQAAKNAALKQAAGKGIQRQPGQPAPPAQQPAVGANLGTLTDQEAARLYDF